MSTQINSSTYSQEDLCAQSSCNAEYSTLSGYNNRPSGFVSGPPVPSTTNAQGVVIVPSYGGVGYDYLQHQLPFNQLSSSGYFTVNNAYVSSGNNCMAYTSALAGK